MADARRSPRLGGYDYRRAGWYFVTVCARNRALVFGDVVEAEVVLSDASRIAQAEWLRTLAARPYLVPDVFVVMPNHVHVLSGLMPDDGSDAGEGRGDMARHVPTNPNAAHPDAADPTAADPNAANHDPSAPDPRSVAGGGGPTRGDDARRRDMACHLPATSGPVPVWTRRAFAAPVGRSVSSIVGSYKAAVAREVNRLWGGVGASLWQSRFHDRIVRDEAERARIRQYILDNPLRWHLDPLKP